MKTGHPLKIGGDGKISVRSFAWHDLIVFYRYRRQIVSTDSAQALTRGSPGSPMAFLARLNPAMGIYTCVYPASDGSSPIIGQMQYTTGDRSARLAFLMPENSLDKPTLADVLEHLAVHAGSRGAFHLLAEAEENSSAMDGLRRSGFAVYAWQRIWKYNQEGKNSTNNEHGNGRGKSTGLWEPATSLDEVAIRSLYQLNVPPLVQSAEPLNTGRLPGWVYRQEGEILGYVEGVQGPQGIYLQPLVHPGIENVSQVLGGLLNQQPRQVGRPVYVAIRSYQAWLETVVRDLEYEVGPRQALMVKHLVLQQRAVVHAGRHSVLEKYTTEPTVPLVHNATANK